MKRGVDTNVLIYAHLPNFPEHRAVRGFLLDQLAGPETTLVLAPSILHELVHVLTDARRFDAPLSMPEATELARSYLGRSNIECLDADEACFLSALDLLDRYRLGRKRVADTLFAATLMHHGVSELITCNLSDFQIFEGLKLIDPRQEPGESREH